jgi:hypothetical protein
VLSNGLLTAFQKRTHQVEPYSWAYFSVDTAMLFLKILSFGAGIDFHSFSKQMPELVMIYFRAQHHLPFLS